MNASKLATMLVHHKIKSIWNYIKLHLKFIQSHTKRFRFSLLYIYLLRVSLIAFKKMNERRSVERKCIGRNAMSRTTKKQIIPDFVSLFVFFFRLKVINVDTKVNCAFAAT